MAAKSASSGSTPVLASGSRVIVVVSKGQPPTPPTAFVNVPDMLGKRQGDALAALQSAGSSAQVFNDYSATYKRGVVMGQLPSAGKSVPTGGDVMVLVSSGPAATETADVVLPDVVGKSEDDAVATLKASGLAPQVVHEFSPTAPAGTVVAQLPNRDSLSATPSGGSPWVWLGVAAAVIALAILAFFMTTANKAVPVPNVVGLTQTQAEQALASAGFESSATPVLSGSPGYVTTQTPAQGTTAKKGSTVVIGVVRPVEEVAVPDVVGKKQTDATSELQAAGFTVVPTEKSSSTVEQGLVIEQTPAGGTNAPKGEKVTIVISTGSANVKVPNVEGLSSADAEKALESAGLKVEAGSSSSDSVAMGYVIAQLPAAGDSVAPGTTVGVVVSTGPATAAQIDVPNVVGMMLTDAQKVLTDAGLKSVSVAASDNSQPVNQVLAQSPSGGTKVQAGAEVVLFYVAP